MMKILCDDSRIQNASSPVLFHPDLNKRNITVSEEQPELITSFIDWQHARVEPGWEYSYESPDFSEPLLDTSGNSETEEKIADACSQTLNASLQLLVPKVGIGRTINEDMIDPIRYSRRIWRGGAAQYREMLIRLSPRWHELGLPGSCPFRLPTSEELTAHEKDMKKHELACTLLENLPKVLQTNREGWVHADDWEASKARHKEVFAYMAQYMADPSSYDKDEEPVSEEEFRQLWLYDLDWLEEHKSGT